MSTPDPSWPVRRRLRLRAFDYTTPTDYFVTICVQEMRCLLGRVDAGVVELSDAGRLVQREWLRLPTLHPGLLLDEHVVMPNHLHGVVSLRTNGSHSRDELRSLGDVIGRFKSVTTVRYGEGVRRHGWPGYTGRLWQRGFHDRVIRNERELDAIREYIRNNPANWSRDRFYRRDGRGPARPPNTHPP